MHINIIVKIQSEIAKLPVFSINEIKRKLPADKITKLRYWLRKQILIIFIGQKNFDLYINNIDKKNQDGSKDYCPLEFGCDEVVQINKPDNKNLADVPSWWFEKMVGCRTIGKPYVFSVKNAQLVGIYAAGFTSDGNIIRETTVPRAIPLERAINIRTVIKQKLPVNEINVPTLDTVFSLVNVHSANYFHWLTDCLARLELVEFYQKQTGIKPKLLIPANLSSWQKESLELTGYTLEDCVYWDKARMKVEQLIVPSFRLDSFNTNNIFNFSPSASQWLRQRMISNLPKIDNSTSSFSPRVLLSRRKAMRRRVINEDEVIKALAPFGFVTYILEEMTVTEQTKLFSQAEIVISPNGAGLANMIFSQNLTLIEMMTEPFDPMYFYLSKLLGFKYYLFNCASTSQKTKFSDVVVDTNQLQYFVESILNLNSIVNFSYV